MFDAIVRSNGWDDATVALQFLSHLEGDTLNIALLVTEIDEGHAGRTSWDTNRTLRIIGPASGLSTGQDGEDPSIFAISLETLAVKAFGDMG